jgi:ABC-2 type transport system ATP-binding protein
LTQRWFDTHLRKTDSLSKDFEVTFASANIIGSNRDNAEPASIESSPNYFGISNFGLSIPLLGQAQQILAPAGGAPAGISTFPGIGSLGGLIGQSLPGQTAIFQSPELEQDLRIVGSSQVQVNVSSDEPRDNAVLFASLQIVSATGSQSLPYGLVSPIRLSRVDQISTTVLVNLPTIAYDAKQGESLRLVISTTDLAYRLPTQPVVYTIELANPALALASMELASTVVTQTSITYIWYALAAIAAVVLLVWILRPRKLKKGIKAELSDVPIAIENLVKQFKNGPRAVNDITYEIPRGEVVGLLGPNGAGKTTTMRMIMGLIMPSEGSVYVFGERVRPGAPVLARIGSLVEGAGFLPHLSGRDNLALYWKASGRSGTANFDEVLEIADLGTAIDRKARTYSQGMRQRLGIAQAMLGMPDILMLDEPTNGLDPPQIKAMRDVLHKYAATGRTVIVSSHLLSEVEQTCSYVIVMHRGQLITAGNVNELLASHNNMRLEDFFLDAVGDDLTIGRS